VPKRRVDDIRRNCGERLSSVSEPARTYPRYHENSACIEGYFTSGEINLIPLSVRIRWKQIHATPRSVWSSIG